MLLLLPGTAFPAEKPWRWIKAEKVQGMLKEGSGLWIIDLRGETAFTVLHIEGSVNIPPAALARKKFSQNKPLVLVDDSLGQRGAREAAEKLAGSGHTQVFLLEGGLFHWASDGRPLVGDRSAARGVTPEELRWALSNKVPLRLFDLRDEFERAKGMVEGSREVKGKKLSDRMSSLAGTLAEEDQAEPARAIGKRPPVVLVFSAFENAADTVRELAVKGGEAMRDIRYLIGGYESFSSENIRQSRMIGACSTCPGKTK